MHVLQAISENLPKGQAEKVKSLVEKALNDGIPWDVVLNDGLFKGMEIVGELFKEGEMYVPEVLMAAKAMEAGQKVLEPLIAQAANKKKLAKIILGTVQGDIHTLGKKLVGTMLKGAGFEVIDAGEDVSAQRFVELAQSEQAQLVGMSALLTSTMPYMKSTIEALKEAGLVGQVKTIIGGPCVTQRYANEIRADGYGENAGVAVTEVKRILGIK